MHPAAEARTPAEPQRTPAHIRSANQRFHLAAVKLRSKPVGEPQSLSGVRRAADSVEYSQWRLIEVGSPLYIDSFRCLVTEDQEYAISQAALELQVNLQCCGL
ncbi:hypothetical protein BaRGS_00004055 [Batillaria attramentaria]|uniref:Uncharacterized protein n=1 Tax=Batillaria attramentaria TaxID=370345 RepID=A0ABD0LYN6_9CAEN